MVGSPTHFAKMVAKQLDKETIKKVIQQVEYYFSSWNLEWDASLMKSITESEDGMVNLAEICSLSNMKRYLELGDNANAEDVPEDIVEAVAETLKNSTTVKISEDGKKVGRKIDLEIERSDCRTIAASPFNKDVNIEDVTSFFRQIAKVNNVKLISGTALIEFSCEEDPTKILTKSLDYKGAKLALKTKKEFDKKKAKEEAKETSRSMLPERKNDSQEEEYPRDLVVEFELRSRTSKKSSAKKMDGKTESMDMVKNEDVVSLEDLKNVYKEFGTVEDIIKTGDITGYIVFDDAKVALHVRRTSADALIAGLDVGNCYAILRGVAGDKEKAYWDHRRGKKKLKAGVGITEEDTTMWIVKREQ